MNQEQKCYVTPAPPATIGEELDRRIQYARQGVESLCIKKAKLEAMNLLNHPYNGLMELLT